MKKFISGNVKFILKKAFSLFIALLILISLSTTYGCERKLSDEETKAVLKSLTEQVNTVFNLFYSSLEYDTTKKSVLGEGGDVFFPAVENEKYNSISDIKEKCESVFTTEYLNENLYGFGLKGIHSEESGDPIYIEKDGILYVNSEIRRSPLEMYFDYNTINIIKQTENEITINIDVFDYNFHPRVQAAIKLEKVGENWLISFLFD